MSLQSHHLSDAQLGKVLNLSQDPSVQNTKMELVCLKGIVCKSNFRMHVKASVRAKAP